MKNLLVIAVLLVIQIQSFAGIKRQKNENISIIYSVMDSSISSLNSIDDVFIHELDYIGTTGIKNLTIMICPPELNIDRTSLIKNTDFASRYRSLFLYNGRKLIV